MPLRVTLLNHASVILDLAPDFSLLSDPWYRGTCFRDGWGLLFDNPDALAEAAKCTHLWVSHFHGDHFHVATLRGLVALRSDIHVLVNASVNLGAETIFQDLGFRHITWLAERTPCQLTADVRVTRIPTTRIDSMLLIETPAWRVLNFNDCALPLSALRALRRRVGRVDVLLNNYNHAGKLLEHPLRPEAEIRAAQLQTFRCVLETLDPRWVIPFASLHYYRAPETVAQNTSLLTLEEVAACDPRVVAVPVGARALFRSDAAPRVEQVHGRVSKNRFTECARDAGRAATELLPLADTFWARLRRQFGPILRMLSQLVIHVSDQDIDLVSGPRGGAYLAPASGCAAFGAHSDALAHWFEDPFGTDAFHVGGHFALTGSDIGLVRLLVMFGMMNDARLTPRELLTRLRARAGWMFLWNRREEIISILVSRRLPVGDRV